MVKQTHRLLEVLFALFLFYLLVTRGFLTWVQYAPDHFTSVLKDLAGVELSYNKLQLDQHWLGFEFSSEDVVFHSKDIHFEASTLDADINVFAVFIPTMVYGDYLRVTNATLEKVTQDNTLESQATIPEWEINKNSFRQKLLIPSSIQALWDQVSIKDMRIIAKQDFPLGLHLRQLELSKSASISLVAELSLKYGHVLDYEPFSLALNASKNALGKLGDGSLNLISYRPVKVKGLVSLLPDKWHDILPVGEIFLEAKAQILDSRLSSVVANLSGQSLLWPQNDARLPKSAGVELQWTLGNKQLFSGDENWHVLLSKLELDNKYLNSISPIEFQIDNDWLDFNAEQLDIEPFKLITQTIVSNPSIAQFFNRTAHLKIQNLDGKLNWRTLELNQLHFYLKKLAIPQTEYPSVAIEEVTFDKTDGKVVIQVPKPFWVVDTRIHKDAIRVKTDSAVFLNIENQNSWHIKPISFQLDEFILNLSKLAYLDTQWNLLADVQANSGKKILEYLPYYLMGEETGKWLKNSQIDSQKLTANIFFKGSKQKLIDSGVKLNGALKSAQLKFQPDWPILRDIDLDFSLENYLLRLESKRFSLSSGILAEDVVVQISDLSKNQVDLNIQGRAFAKVDDALSYLWSTPILEKLEFFDGVNKGIEINGNGRFEIQTIRVPLASESPKKLSLKIGADFQQASVLKSGFPKISNLSGSMKVTESSVKANLKGKLFEGPFDASIEGDGDSLNITLNGDALDDQQLLFEKPVSWQGSILIPNKNSESDSHFTGSVDWHQSATKMLPPLSISELTDPLTFKGRFSKSNFDVNFESEGFGKGSLSLPVTKGQAGINVDNAINGSILLGSKIDNPRSWESYESQTKGFEVGGSINEFKLHRWIKYLELINQHYFSAESSKSVQLNWQPSQLYIKKLSFDEYLFPNAQVSWKAREDDMLYRIVGPNADIAVIQKADESLDIQVGQMKLDPKGDSKNEQTNQCMNASPLEGVPKINFFAKELVFKGYSLRNLEFNLSPNTNGFFATDLKGVLGKDVGYLSGAYSFNQFLSKSSLVLFLKSDRVEALTNYLGVNEGFRGKKASGKIQVNWSGDLACFNPQKLNGPLDFKIEEGQIQNIEPGLARLLGLLSVDSIIRRLKLDLKDVTSKGLVFDVIEANGSFAEDKIKLELLQVKAPSANVEVAGELLLKDETFNMYANVTPSLGSSIPTVAALAGAANPLAAIAIYTLMKVLPDINEELVSFRYKITGPWKDPILEVVN